jgi:hypothetical protein
MFCSKCGAKNNDDASFCSGCGSALPLTPQNAGVAGQATTPTPSAPKVTPKDAKANAVAAQARARALRPWYKKKRFWLLGIVAIIVIVNIANSNKSGSGGGSTATTAPVNAGAALTAYFKQVNSALSRCVVGIGATQIELGQALGANATSADYVNLYRAANQAEGPCDPVQNDALNNIGLGSAPSGYPSLSNFGIDAQIWASSDSVKVLKDIEAYANDPSSTADVATLITDADTADADAHTLNSQAAQAAGKAGVKNIGGDMLLYWGLHTT